VALGLAPTGDAGRVFHTYLDYGAFLSLMGALYVVSGGIHIRGVYEGFPFVNTFFLAVGALLSNVLGTTGASMLLIRPLLHANRHRKHKAHILIFFIFIVSNGAACLIPLGPPLYLGYLRGVPFLWTFRLLGPWGLVVGLLLVLFHFIDGRIFEKEEVESKGRMSLEIHLAARKIQIRGWINTFFLTLVLGDILFSGYVLQPFMSGAWGEERGDLGSKGFQIVTLVALAFASYRLTPKAVHELNLFHFAPLQEVAILFFGIFGSMIPPLALLEAKGPAAALTQPWQYFWVSGILSAFLDNAPAYLNFTTLAATQCGIASNHLGELAVRSPRLLAAISCGTSFMGAMTYVGNGPNFMVKAIAEHYRVKMPSFGGYMLWSTAVLVPVLLLVTFIFF
jgi:Na+/H+ antiporter NhaD/arsenite permease-like protein